MFPNLKPTFGPPANNTSFGFSSNVTSNPFGQSFGKSTTSGFGTPSTAFGSTSTPLFGTTSQHGSLFANTTPTASFGQTTQPTFGSGMFGNASQPSGSGLFGTANTSAFGQQNKTSGFGFGSNTANSGFFGQPANQVQGTQQNTNLFGQTSTNLFGASSGPSKYNDCEDPVPHPGTDDGHFHERRPEQSSEPSSKIPLPIGRGILHSPFRPSSGFGSNTSNSQLGTVLKFTPVTGTDTMVKGSINQTISTRHHCITCMKEYENKSLEELRWEDYQANRKGPQQTTQSAGGLFGNISQPVGGGLFGSGAAATSSNTLFGQQENKSVFGSSAPTPGFGQSTSGFGSTPSSTSTGLFGKPLAGFGATATTSSFPFSSTAQQQSTYLFGQNTASKPFGVGGTSQPNTLFGQPSSFGTQSTFGSFGTNTNQNVGLFNQNKTTPFNMGTSNTSSFGSFGQPNNQNTGSLFPSTKTTGFSGFGATTTAPVFGQSAFGQTNQSLFNSSFNKTAAPLFGQTNTTHTIGAGLSMGGGSTLFGNTANKPNNMFAGMFNSGFGTGSNTTSFNLGGANTQPGVANADQSHISGEQQIISMSSTPYGLSNLLNNIPEVDNDLKDSTRPTNPGELNALLNTVNKSQTHTPIEKLQPVQVFGRKVPMFDGLEHKDETLISNIRINSNPKRLVIRNNSINNRESIGVDTVTLNSSWNAYENDNNTANANKVTEGADKENICTENNNADTNPKHSLVGPLFERTVLNASINNSNPPLTSTMITSPSKTLNLTQDANNDSDDKDDEVDLFTEASESQDWQDDPSNVTSTTSTSLATKSTKNDSKSTTSSDSSTKSLAHPTGIVLSRPEYYTVPSLEELVKYISEDGSCVVQGFTIGRVGYGSVYFPEAFDVSNLNLDELVHFRHKEINLYPDDSKKPPQGQGLNRRAQVTLDNVWPFDKNTKVHVKDAEVLAKMDYAGRLRRLCEKQSTRFVDYRPDTGSWVFKVDHFSKYGHRDSDDSDEEVGKNVEVNRKQLAGGDKNVAEANAAAGDAEKVQNLPKEKAVEENQEGQFQPLDYEENEEVFICIDNYDHFPGRSLNISGDNSKCALMKSTFFEKEITDYDDNISDVGSSEGGIIELSNYVSRSSPKRTEFSIGKYIPEPTLVMDILEDDPEHLFLGEEEPETVQISFLKESVPREEIHTSSYSVSDVCAMKGKSFRVGWGKNMTFVTSLTCDFNIEEHQDVSVPPTNEFAPAIVRNVNIMQLRNKDSKLKSIEKHLECQLSFSKFTDADNLPHFASETGYNLLNGHQKLMTGGVNISKYEKQIWDLCIALWGKIERHELQKYDRRLIRKRLFSEWIKQTVDETVNNELDKNHRHSLSNVLTCVSGNRIEQAAKIALENNDLNLSLLISQLPTNNTSRSYIEKQLNQWFQCSVYQQFDQIMLKLYILAAGKPFTDIENFCVYDKMDWIRVLAMYFWYIIEPGQTLSTAVNSYEDVFSNHSHTAKPIPPYEGALDNIYDLRFQLLKFYSDNGYPLAHVLNPSTHTDDFLDYSLSWLLLQTLTSLGHTDISKQIKLYMHVNFAAQLEQMGLWHWAIFVLLFIEEHEIKEMSICDVLGRHVEVLSQSTDEYLSRETMLVQQFHIPLVWIEGAKATSASVCRYNKEAVYHLISARQWQQAHDVVVEHLIPDHFLCYDYEFLISVLTPLSEQKDSLVNWDEAGGLVLDFAKLGVSYNDIMTSRDPINIRKKLINFRSAVLNVSIRFKRFPPLTYLHDVCLAEMCGRIAAMLRKLISITSDASSDVCADTANSTQDLPMTGDYLKQEMNSLLTDFVNENQWN